MADHVIINSPSAICHFLLYGIFAAIAITDTMINAMVTDIAGVPLSIIAWKNPVE
jgi:hypothetical protein